MGDDRVDGEIWRGHLPKMDFKIVIFFWKVADLALSEHAKSTPFDG